LYFPGSFFPAFSSFPVISLRFDMDEEEDVPFAVALRRRVGRVTGNAGKDHRNDEIACNVNVSITSVPIAAGLPSLRLVEDERSQHWGGHVWYLNSFVGNYWKQVTLTRPRQALCTLLGLEPRPYILLTLRYPQARVLVDYFVSPAPSFPDIREHFGGKRVIELGAGTGLVGLALAASGRPTPQYSALGIAY
jgi:hypothetical protein